MKTPSNPSVWPNTGTIGLAEPLFRTYSQDEIDAIHGLRLLEYQKLRAIYIERKHNKQPVKEWLLALQYLEELLKQPDQMEIEPENQHLVEEHTDASVLEETNKVATWFASLPGRNDPVTAWELVLLGLELITGNYPKADHDPKNAPQRGSPGRGKGGSSSRAMPTWNYLIYTLLCRVPGNRLKLHHIYNLCLAWCPDLAANSKDPNGNCRHSLKESPEFAQDPEDSSDPGDWHRIATAEEYEKAKARARPKKPPKSLPL